METVVGPELPFRVEVMQLLQNSIFTFHITHLDGELLGEMKYFVDDMEYNGI